MGDVARAFVVLLHHRRHDGLSNYLTSTRGASTGRVVKRVSRRYRVTLVGARVALLRNGRGHGRVVGRGKAEKVAGIIVAPWTAVARLQGQRVITC